MPIWSMCALHSAPYACHGRVACGMPVQVCQWPCRAVRALERAILGLAIADPRISYKSRAATRFSFFAMSHLWYGGHEPRGAPLMTDDRLSLIS